MADEKPWIATKHIPLGAVLAFAAGDFVPDWWVKAHPEAAEGRVDRPGTKAAEKAISEIGG